MAQNRKLLEHIYGGRFNRIYALDGSFWNLCYYCGDVATEMDHVPPISTVEFFDVTREPADFFLVPSCKECNLLGGSEPLGILDARAEYIREKLKWRHRKHWRQTQLWTEEEVDELIESEGNTSITRSLKAIVNSEEDLQSRLQFKGYLFEVRGSKHTINYERSTKFNVFGVSFDTFKEALHYAINAYKVKADVLYSYAVESGGNVEKALNKIFKEQEELIDKKELENMAKLISDRYLTPQAWVYQSLKSLKAKYPEKALEEIRILLIEKYIENS